MEETKFVKTVRNGKTVLTVTTTDAVVHPLTRTSLTRLIDEYNVSEIWPYEGLDPTENYYDLPRAITVLSEKLEDQRKKLGVKVKFINIYGELEEWEYIKPGLEFTDEKAWERLDVNALVKVLQETYFNIDLTTSADIILVGNQVKIYFYFQIMFGREDVTHKAKVIFDDVVLPTGSEVTSVVVNPEEHAEYTYKMIAQYAGMEKEVEVVIYAVHPSYYGIVGKDWEINFEDLNEIIIPRAEYTWKGINLFMEKTVFAYPAYMGDLYSIKDKSFDYIDSYDKVLYNKDGVDYFVYSLSEPVKITGFSQIFNDGSKPKSIVSRSGGGIIETDTALDETSENPIQNKTVAAKFALLESKIAEIEEYNNSRIEVGNQLNVVKDVLDINEFVQARLNENG